MKLSILYLCMGIILLIYIPYTVCVDESEPTTVEFDNSLMNKLKATRHKMDHINMVLQQSPKSLQKALKISSSTLKSIKNVELDASNVKMATNTQKRKKIKKKRKKSRKKTRRRRRRKSEGKETKIKRKQKRQKTKRHKKAAVYEISKLLKRKLPKKYKRKQKHHALRNAAKSLKSMVASMIDQIIDVVDNTKKCVRVFTLGPWQSKVVIKELKLKIRNLRLERTKCYFAITKYKKTIPLAQVRSYRRKVDNIWKIALSLKKSIASIQKAADTATSIRKLFKIRHKAGFIDSKQNAFLTLYNAKVLNIRADELLKQAKFAFEYGKYSKKTSKKISASLSTAASSMKLAAIAALQSLRGLIRVKNRITMTRISSGRAKQALNRFIHANRIANNAFHSWKNMRYLKTHDNRQALLSVKGSAKIELHTLYKMAYSYMKSSQSLLESAKNLAYSDSFLESRERTAFAQKSASECISVAVKALNIFDKSKLNTIGDLLMETNLERIIQNALNLVEDGIQLRQSSIIIAKNKKNKKKKKKIKITKKTKKGKINTKKKRKIPKSTASISSLKQKVMNAYNNLLHAQKRLHKMRKKTNRNRFHKANLEFATSIEAIGAGMENVAYFNSEATMLRHNRNGGVRLESLLLLNEHVRKALMNELNLLIKDKHLYLNSKRNKYKKIVPAPPTSQILSIAKSVTNNILNMETLMKSAKLAIHHKRLLAAEQQAAEMDFACADILHFLSSSIMVIENQGKRISASDIIKLKEIIKTTKKALFFSKSTQSLLYQYRQKIKHVYKSKTPINVMKIAQRSASVFSKMLKARRYSEKMAKLIESKEFNAASSAGQIAYYEVGKSIRRLATMRENFDTYKMQKKKLTREMKLADRGIGGILIGAIKLAEEIVRVRLVLDKIDERANLAKNGIIHPELAITTEKSLFQLKSTQVVYKRALKAMKRKHGKEARMFATQTLILAGQSLQVVDWAIWVLEEHRRQQTETKADTQALYQLDYIATETIRLAKSALKISQLFSIKPPTLSTSEKKWGQSIRSQLSTGKPITKTFLKNLSPIRQKFVKTVLKHLK